MDSLPVFEPNLVGLLSLVVTFLLPLLVGLITTRVTAANWKALALLALAAVKTVVEAVLATTTGDASFEIVPVIYGTAITFALAAAVHFGLWKPTGASAVVQKVLVTSPEPEPAKRATPAKRTTTAKKNNRK